MSGQGTGEFTRETAETKVKVRLTLAGSGCTDIDTGLGSLDHMLSLLAFWAGFDLELQASGDLDVDAHHTVEDVGLCLGEALQRAVGDKKGMARVGWARVPMDEALCEAVVDLSGRPYLVYQDEILPAAVLGQERDLWREFFKSLAFRAAMNLHIRYLYGKNGHHLLEAACKATGLSLRQALAGRNQGILSTKGGLD
jgi:imidazoleglycerol-phosphate dehydratase